MSSLLSHRASAPSQSAVAIGAALELIEPSIPYGFCALVRPVGGDHGCIEDAPQRADLIGQEIRLPHGLLGDGAAGLDATALRVPLAWTVACGGRPDWFFAAPVPHCRLHLIAVGIGPHHLSVERLSSVANLLGRLVQAGEATKLTRDASERLQALVRHVPVPVLFVDAMGAHEVQMNDEAAVLLGLAEGMRQPQAVAGALARLINAKGRHSLHRALTEDPHASLQFEIQQAGRDFRTDSRWIDDESLCGRLWMFTDITREKALQRQLADLAAHDPLTGILNRGSFDLRLREEIERAGRHRTPLGLLLFDLDHFKAVNDGWGHPAGDKVLKAAAAAAGAVLRGSDVFARIGGEEFAVILPETSAQGMLGVAERIRVAVAALEVPHGDALLRVTCSIGAAVHDAARNMPEALVARADEALYAAKRGGRNRVVATGELATGT
ncbi:GGDEF domain-containing protein [Allosphingosinicella deserti]|nr:GGDEF domain-containing protein [Sphingomonas deserti]